MAVLRSVVSIALGATIALGLLGAIELCNVNLAHAQLEAADILGDDVQQTAGFGDATVNETIAGLIKVFLGFLGIITIATILTGGFIWMTASGNHEALEKAKKTMANGFIGLTVVVSAYAISSFIISKLLESTS